MAGVALLLEPLGSISGRVILENKPGAEHKDNCKSTRESFIDEITLIARRDILKQKTNQSVSLRGVSREYIPDEKGEFLFRALEPGQYRIDTRENWYIRAMTLQSTGNAKMDDPVRNGISIKPGQRLTGLTITVAEGAASLRGRVTAANEGSSSPERLRVHIIPAEREQADNILRFRETSVQSDGSFEIKNIAPGRYWLITRPISDEELDESNPRPAVWDASKRIMLRREVEASSTVIEFHPCQRIVDYVLRYGPAVSKPAYIK